MQRVVMQQAVMQQVVVQQNRLSLYVQESANFGSRDLLNWALYII
jgi:hypothetical protein